ncbi:Espin-like protein [Triplophysa tibetana]|uniref:Espin-like protein n=1 Tax=Triplophysa tibetana TaxID=1572043 RepID=A0A5A9MRR4_9TELE|nr:Espin-like protein [Triplophysa tibetana]
MTEDDLIPHREADRKPAGHAQSDGGGERAGTTGARVEATPPCVSGPESRPLLCQPKQVHGQAEDLPSWCSKISTLLKSMAILLATLWGVRKWTSGDDQSRIYVEGLKSGTGRSEMSKFREHRTFAILLHSRGCGKGDQARRPLHEGDERQDSSLQLVNEEPIIPSHAPLSYSEPAESIESSPSDCPDLPANPAPNSEQLTRSLEVQTDLSYVQECIEMRKERIVFLFLEHWRKYTMSESYNHPWEVIRQFHREVMESIERGKRDWSDGFEDIKVKHFGDSVEGGGLLEAAELILPPDVLQASMNSSQMAPPYANPSSRPEVPADIPMRKSSTEAQNSPQPENTTPQPTMTADSLQLRPTGAHTREEPDEDSIKLIYELKEFSNEEIIRYIDRSFAFWKEKEGRCLTSDQMDQLL